MAMDDTEMRRGGLRSAPQAMLGLLPQEAPEAVAEGVFRMRLAWTQVYVLTDNSSTGSGDFALCDTGTRSDRMALLAALRSLGLDAKRCRAVLLTHGHCDHAGNAAFFAARGAVLMAHEDERRFLETCRTYVARGWRALSPVGMAQSLMFVLGELLYPVRRHRLDRALRDGERVMTPAGEWRVVHTPGHTPGHIAFWRESDGTLLSGDALLTVKPFVRRDELAVPPAIFNADTQRVPASARRLSSLEPRTLLPGHGKPLREDTAAQITAFVAALPR